MMIDKEEFPMKEENETSNELKSNSGCEAEYNKPVLPIMRESFSLCELACVFISWVVGYAYTFSRDAYYADNLITGILTVFFGIVLMTYFIHKDRKFTVENYIWFCCLAISVAGYILGEVYEGLYLGVWDPGYILFFVHVYAVWFVLSTSGKMYKGETSTYLILDAINGFVCFPFRYIFHRLKVEILAIKSLFSKKEKRAHNYYLIPAIILSAVLFFTAANLLGQADSGFGKILDNIRDFFRWDFELDEMFVMRLFFSIPVGAYLFGLIVGTSKVNGDELERKKTAADSMMSSLRKIPVNFWTTIICMFSLLYLVFFAFQFRYLFGAFTRTLPEGFIVSQYAREGFFELCKVMGVNFALLICVTRLVTREGSNNNLFKYACIAMLAESIIFAVIAFSKLALYIDCFGFTPLRIQSLWLICVLFAACVLWTVSIVNGKKTFKLWLYIGAISLALLTLL